MKPNSNKNKPAVHVSYKFWGELAKAALNERLASPKEVEELIEHFKIYEMVQKRLKDPRPNIPWETIKKKYGL
ncbi:MAG: hypothetical protein M1591_07165 [Deltaproteobacteria bacterium]|nr:hypothetical protein [Deltaproteobacteria bacterium]